MLPKKPMSIKASAPSPVGNANNSAKKKSKSKHKHIALKLFKDRLKSNGSREQTKKDEKNRPIAKMSKKREVKASTPPPCRTPPEPKKEETDTSDMSGRSASTPSESAKASSPEIWNNDPRIADARKEADDLNTVFENLDEAKPAVCLQQRTFKLRWKSPGTEKSLAAEKSEAGKSKQWEVKQQEDKEKRNLRQEDDKKRAEEAEKRRRQEEERKREQEQKKRQEEESKRIRTEKAQKKKDRKHQEEEEKKRLEETEKRRRQEEAERKRGEASQLRGEDQKRQEEEAERKRLYDEEKKRQAEKDKEHEALLETATKFVHIVKRNNFMEGLLLEREEEKLRLFFTQDMRPDLCTAEILDLIELGIERMLDRILFKGDQLDVPIDNEIRLFIINRLVAKQSVFEVMLTNIDLVPFAWGGRAMTEGAKREAKPSSAGWAPIVEIFADTRSNRYKKSNWAKQEKDEKAKIENPNASSYLPSFDAKKTNTEGEISTPRVPQEEEKRRGGGSVAKKVNSPNKPPPTSSPQDAKKVKERKQKSSPVISCYLAPYK